MKQKGIQFIVDCDTPGVCKCHVVIPQSYIKQFFKHASQVKQIDTQSIGFKKGSVPLDYIETHYKKDILDHMQEIFLKHFVIDVLLENLQKNKLLVVGKLQLTAVDIDSNKDATYSFEGILPKEVYIQRWKHLPFKATQRKKYRDIDNQVKSFLEEESKLEEAFKNQDTIQIEDWVCFDAWIVDTQKKSLFLNKKSNLWLKIGNEEPDVVFQEIFLGKKINDLFITDNPSLRHYFCDIFDAPYTYAIQIKDRLSHQYFSIESLKNHFKIKTKKDLHNKLIEIFSYSSDVSQRRSTAETALNTIIKRNNILVPPVSVDTQKHIIVNELKLKPDYNIYKMKPDFDDHITTLAKKQIYEMVVADHIAYSENLTANHQDLKSYLNLLQRTRTKEFLYFPIPETRIEGQEAPISKVALEKSCIREKALNHIIYHLTK